MGNKLKAGGLGTSIPDGGGEGIPPEFAGSLAKAMEDALNQLLQEEDKPQVPTENTTETRDRRIMFIAIARGIVEHLTDNEAAFTIHRDDDTLRTNHNVKIAKE